MNVYHALKRKVFEAIDDEYGESRLNKTIDIFIVALILLNVLEIIIESFDSVYNRNKALFDGFDNFSVAVFTIEYLLRVWTAECKYNNYKLIFAKGRFIVSPGGIIDLIAILPAYLSFAIVDLRFVRIFKLTRLLRVLKLSRYSNALKIVYRVIKNRKDELMATVFITGILLLVSSILIYYVERDAHSEAFPNIVSALWWAVATLTTIGYGDVYPVTALGKLLSGIIAILGIGLVALPTGIISSGFLDEIRKKGEPEKGANYCPHCGMKIKD